MTEPDAPSATGVRRRRAKRGEGARLREELLAAARQLLDERGESAVTVRAVAQRVGVSTPAVYLHFASRTELVHGVCRGVWDRLDAYMAEAAAAAEDPFEELRRRCAAYIRFGLDHPLHYGLVAAGPATEATAQVADACFRELHGAVRRCLDASLLEGDGIALTRAVCACLHGAVSLLLLQSPAVWPRDLERYAEDVAAVACAGVRHHADLH